jgi:hypothetical protein
LRFCRQNRKDTGRNTDRQDGQLVKSFHILFVKII